MERRWYKKAVEAKPPYYLGGWSKSQSAPTRRRRALSSRSRRMSLDSRYLSAARALQALANVTKDKPTRRAALADARYFFAKARKTK